MNKSVLLALFTSTVLATGAFAQSSGTDTNSSTTTTGQSGTSVITPDTNSSAGTTGSSGSGTTGTGGSSTSQDSNIAGQNPNPNIYGGNRGGDQSGSGDNRYAQQYRNQDGNFGQGMNPWGYHGGHHAMMQEMMRAATMQPGMGMTCVTPAPNTQVPGSFACFPTQQMGQGMGNMGMGNMGMGGQQMGQYGYNSNRSFDDSQRYGWNQRGYNPYGNQGYGQYGQNFGAYGNSFGSGIPYGYGTQYGVNDGIGATSPNWYYENRNRQFSRSNDDYDRDRYGSSDYSSNSGRSNRYDSDTTGSMSRPNTDAGNYDYRSNDRSSQPYYDDQRND